ncbi:VOC family protein [Alteromonas oceanisediminis]|uniref:VOC family protein n=1 Tax=Alteromonas oceanisediminis TaxID=2836180 RepID=UPI001BDA58A6|nr:VOC family protein [Alteromonas oceanisediminis]MBT0586150.1 VOC family protein [Alteromonas oceanisediminis]
MSITNGDPQLHSDEIPGTDNFPKLNDRIFCGTQSPVLHHVCLFVPDIDASVRFYTSGLGLSVRETFDDIIGLRTKGNFPFKVRSVFIQAGEGRYIELHPAGDGAMQAPGFPLNHLAIAVVSVDEAYQQALNAGGKTFGFSMQEADWDGTPMDVIMAGERSEPMRMAFLQGPSGELVELYQAPIKALEQQIAKGE